MKKLMIGLLVALMAASSFGGLVVLWTTGGFLDGPSGVADEGPWIFSDGTGESASVASTTKAIWELVYTKSSTIGDISFDEATGNYSYATGDTVLSSRVSDGSANWLVDGSTTLASDEFGAPKTGITFKDMETTLSEGNIYAAVFQYTSSGDVYYALTDLNTDITWTAGTLYTGDKVHFNTGADTALNYLGKVTQVPEPATMGLLGLGALAMVLRRKLRK